MDSSLYQATTSQREVSLEEPVRRSCESACVVLLDVNLAGLHIGLFVASHAYQQLKYWMPAKFR